MGDFSRFLLDSFNPSEFHAFDLFQLHEETNLWGQSASEIFGGKTHVEFYRDVMPEDEVIIHEGPSAETLKNIHDRYLDLAYIDGVHVYEGVLEDARECERALNSNGILVFNDYVMYDPFIKADYGIVPVVNQMVVNESWQVIGFALQKHMFCDIAIKRR